MQRNRSATGSCEPLRVLLAIYDFPILNQGFRAAIDAEPDMGVIGEADSREALAEQLTRNGVDVVVTECLPIGIGECTSFQQIEAIREASPGVKVIAMECRCSSEQFQLALKAGADGFLTREARPSDVVTAVRAVSHGQTYVSPAIVTRMVNTYVLRNASMPVEDAYEALSDREHEVLLLAAVGHTNRDIAQTLHLSEQTIHNYRANIMEKLGFHDRMDLLKFAIRRGIISVADL